MSFVPPMTDWMKHITNPDLLLSALSIPGTHDSASVSVMPFIATQTLTISEQLDQGIRFFDLRINLKRPIFDPHNPYLMLVHDEYPLQLRLDLQLEKIYAWLENHDQEALVVQIKHDGTLDPHFTWQQFDKAVFDLLNKESKYWRFDATIPTLTQARKKIQLVRRIGHPESQTATNAGLDTTAWQHNSSNPFDIVATPGVPTKNIRIQDHYQLDGTTWSTIPEKSQLVESLMKEAAVAPITGPWFFNYASAVSLANWPWAKPISNWAQPFAYAQGYYDHHHQRYCHGVNARIRDYLATLPAKTRCGTLVMDFPSGEYSTTLISAIVQMNDLTP